jgi:hypothetical protein
MHQLRSFLSDSALTADGDDIARTVSPLAFPADLQYIRASIQKNDLTGEFHEALCTEVL